MHLDKRGEEAHWGGGTMKPEWQLELESWVAAVTDGLGPFSWKVQLEGKLREGGWARSGPRNREDCVYRAHAGAVGAAVRPTDRPAACGWDGHWWGAAATLRSDHVLSPVCHAVCWIHTLHKNGTYGLREEDVRFWAKLCFRKVWISGAPRLYPVLSVSLVLLLASFFLHYRDVTEHVFQVKMW